MWFCVINICLENRLRNFVVVVVNLSFVECNENTSKMTGITLDDVKISMQRFGWPDYLVFLLMLVSCSLVGVYFGFIEKKSKKGKEESDYLVGGRQMQMLPISMSLIARYVQSRS